MKYMARNFSFILVFLRISAKILMFQTAPRYQRIFFISLTVFQSVVIQVVVLYIDKSAWKDEASNWNVHLWMTALLAAAGVVVIVWVVGCRVRALKVKITERDWNWRPRVNENGVRVRTDQRSDALMRKALVSGTSNCCFWPPAA